MGVYVNLKCRSCGNSLTGGYTPTYAGIGEPLLTCAKCQAQNSHADRCTEWQLMGPARKIWLAIALSWSTLFYWGFGGFIVAAVLDSQGMVDGQGFVVTMIAIPLIGFIRLYLYFQRSIRASNARMTDDAYRWQLRRHGLA